METPEQITHFLDQADALERDTIEEYGWAIQYVFGDDEGPPFAYTVGLTALGHPELILIGASQNTSAGVLNNLGERIRAGHRLPRDLPLHFDGWDHRAWLVDVPDSSEYLLWANDRYQDPDGPPIPAVQVVHDDRNGRFPWDPGYAIPADIQPVLGHVPHEPPG